MSGARSSTESPWRRRLVLAAGPIALAGAMLVYFTSQSGPKAPELPLYAVTATGPNGEPSARLAVPRSAARGARFEVVLRPATAPLEKVVAYAFEADPSDVSEPAPLEAKVSIAPDGAVTLSGSTRALEGAAEIRVVVGAPEAIGKFVDAAARAKAGTSEPRVQVLVVPIDRP